ncbi:MAG: XrtA/PEP-CTERM system TPR-repeat protein PrsT [Cellvibrionaceae bacterium]
MSLTRMLVILSVSLLAACSPDYDEVTSLSNANAYYESRDYSASIIELKNILKNNPENLDARLLLAKSLYELSEYSEAEATLNIYLENNGDVDKAYPVMSSIYLELRDLESLNALDLNVLSGEAKIVVNLAIATGQIWQGNLDDAKEIIDLYSSRKSDFPPYELASARILIQLGRYEEAEDLLTRMIDIDPSNYLALLELGDLSARNDEKASALEYFTKVLTVNPYRYDANLKRAILHIQLDNIEMAGEDLKVVSKRHPEAISVNYLVGIHAYLGGNLDLAEKALEVASVAHEAYPSSLYYLGEINYKNGNTAKAEDYLNRYLSISPESVSAVKMLALINLKRGDFSEADSYIDAIWEDSASDIELKGIRATALMEIGRLDESIRLLDEVSRLTPDSEKAKLNLSLGYLRKSDHVNSIKTLEKIVEENPASIESVRLLFLNYIYLDDLTNASRVVEEYTRNDSENSDALNMNAILSVKRGDIDVAIDDFRRVISLFPENLFAVSNLANIYITRKEFDEAESVYRPVLALNDSAVLSNYGKIKLLQNDEQSFIDYQRKSIEANSSNMDARMALANYYLTQSDYDNVGSAFLGAVDVNEDKNYLKVMALAEYGKSEFSQSIFYLEQLKDVSKIEEPAIHYHLSKAKLALGDKSSSENELLKSLDIDPDHYPSLLAISKLFLAQEKLEGMEVHLRKLNSVYSNELEVKSLMSSYHAALGETSKAIDYAKIVYQSKPTSNGVLALAALYWDAGDTQEALALINQWIEENPEDVLVRETLSDFYLLDNKFELASEQLKAILRFQPNNVAALNNLAWILIENDSNLAIEYAEKAVAIRSDLPGVMDTLAMAYLGGGELENAWRSIRKATTLDPNSASIKYHSAVIAVEVGEKEYSRSTLQGLIDGTQSFPERELALALLKDVSN